MKIDHFSSAASHPAVMPTRPARMPLHSAETDSCLSTNILIKKTVRPPAAADNVVFMHTICIATWLAPVAPKADPPLNPYHPNHRIIVPKQTNPTLCGANSSLGVSGSNLPIRGPSYCAPTKPQTPPSM